MSSANVPSVNDKQFDETVINAQLPVLVAFSATWCGPCRALAPILERISSEFQGRVMVVTVDIDDSPEVTKKYGIRSVPTTLVFRGGQKTGQQIGLTNREKLVTMLGV